MKAVAVYSRVSTADQNAEMQVRALREYRERVFPNQEYMEFTDVCSGADRKRPGLDGLIKMARAGKLDTVVVWTLDRLGRSLVHTVELLQTFERFGVSLVCTQQPIDTHGPAGMLVVHVLAAAAEFERAMIRERCAAGRARYEADLAAGRVGKTVQSRSGKNLPPHRPHVVFDRERVFKLRSEGLSLERISKEMKIGRGTVQRTLANWKPLEVKP